MTNDSDLLSEDVKGCPVFEGKTMHQYTQEWAKPQFTVNKKNGQKRLDRQKRFWVNIMTFTIHID